MNYETYLAIAAIIISSISAISALKMYQVTKRDKEHSVIVEIVKDFLIPTVDTLKEDRRNLNKINISSFPDFLDFQFGILDRFLKRAIFDRFAKRKLLLKRKIMRYSELCLKINKEIGEFKNMAYKEGVVTSSVTKEYRRGHTVIVDQYENEEIMKILEEKGLNKNIKDIEVVSEKLSLDKKANELIRKLEKIKRKQQDKYNLTDEELGCKGYSS